jgi:hypothetical protein
MKKSTKIWLGIATIWPIAYIFLFVGGILLTIAIGAALDPGPHAPVHDSQGSILFPLGFIAFFLVHILTILGSLALTVFYIIRVFKTEQLDQNMKIMWMLLLFFMGMLAQPVFWYLYIWRDTSGGSNQPRLIGDSKQRPWAANSNAREPEYVPPSQPPDWR